MVGAVLNAGGQWIRFVGVDSLTIIMVWPGEGLCGKTMCRDACCVCVCVRQIGQTVAAVAQAFTLAVPARLSAVWFGADERNTATALGVMANQV